MGKDVWRGPPRPGSEFPSLSSPCTAGLPRSCWCLSRGGSGGGWQNACTPSHCCSGGFLGFSSLTDLINHCGVSLQSWAFCSGLGTDRFITVTCSIKLLPELLPSILPLILVPWFALQSLLGHQIFAFQRELKEAEVPFYLFAHTVSSPGMRSSI